MVPIFAHRNTKRPVRLGVRTPDFHSGNRGSIPLRATRSKIKISKSLQNLIFCKLLDVLILDLVAETEQISKHFLEDLERLTALNVEYA